MIELTEQQLQALDTDNAPRLIDPRTRKEYVLIGAALFDRFQGLLADGDGPDMKEVGVLVDRAMREDDEGDPTLAYYAQRYGNAAMIRRGDVVVVRFPFTDTGQAKVRPAVVVQNDRDNQTIRKTVIAMITGNLRRSADPSHLLVDPDDADGASSGLSFPSLISCFNLYTVEQSSILQVIGHLSDPLKVQLAVCLKAALELS